jgi:hypothetical protein
MNQDWLAQLAPAHAPAAVGWWPPAPGWWVLGVLCVLLTAALIWTLLDPRRALRRAAIRQLQVIRASDADGPAVARATQNLIRRYAVEVFGRDRVARLTGEEWLSFVMDCGGDELAGAPGRSMLAAAFGNQASDDREQWFAAAEGFIKRAGRGRRGRGVGRAPSGSEDAAANASAQSRGAGYAGAGGNGP